MKRRVASRSIRMINKHTDVWCWIFRTADHLKHQTCCSPEHITNAQHESQRAVSGTCRPSVLSHTVASGNEVALQRWQCWRRANSWLIAAAFFFFSFKRISADFHFTVSKKTQTAMALSHYDQKYSDTWPSHSRVCSTSHSETIGSTINLAPTLPL